MVVIRGSSNPDHIQENTEFYDFELMDVEMAQINALDLGKSLIGINVMIPCPIPGKTQFPSRFTCKKIIRVVTKQ